MSMRLDDTDWEAQEQADAEYAYIDSLKEQLAEERSRLDLVISMATPSFVQFTSESGKVTWALIDDSVFDEAKPAGWTEPKRYPTARAAIDAHLNARKTGANPYV